MPEPPRSAAGYRQYTPEHVAHIRFIKRAQELGFTLEEIHALLSLRATPESGAEVRRKTAVEQGLRERFEHAHRARAHAEQSMEAGRAYVASYVEFVHYAKRLLQDATHNAVHGQEQMHVVH